MQKVTININVTLSNCIDDFEAREILFQKLNAIGIEYTIEDLWIEEDTED